MKIEDLYPNPKNPRKISDAQLERLKKSLEAFGDLSGIVFNEVTGHLAGGHQRIKCLPKDAVINITKKYDEPTNQGTVALGHIKINGELFSYRQVRWDEPTELAANVAANKHGGDWGDNLADILLEIDAANIDLSLTGFDEEELKNLMAPVYPVRKCDEDEVPDQVEPKTKLGDLYKLGNHRLLCGDSTNIQHVERLMNGEKADMVYTDPPYGISIVKTGTVGASAKIGFVSPKNAPSSVAKARQYKAIEGDDQPFDPNLILGLGVKTVILWGANHYASKLPDRPQWLIWDKKLESGALDHNNFSDCELAWTNQSALSAKIYRHTWSGMLRKGERKEELKDRVHPTQKPVGLCESVLLDFSKEKESVLDIYGGSGSTLIACEKTNRKCFMMELDPHYCDVIVARWEKYTGEKAELIV